MVLLRATLVLRHIVSGNEDCVEMREVPGRTSGAGDWTQGWFRSSTDEATLVTMSMNDVFTVDELVPRKPKRGITPANMRKLRVMDIVII